MTTATQAETVTDRLTVNQLARREQVHVATPWRWMLSGVHGIKLRSVRVGGRRFILESDWQAFSAALNADLADAPAAPTPAAPTPAAVTARAERAGRELATLLTPRRRAAK
ncbi:hypothetical protein LBMAG52_31630 [Planctomycetia bacterium]|nr:hypothetical protein LBMAG52_31630 [Planctomycetia bacterium]